MPNYHPIDVRYKGPSTAYRGSADGKRQAKTPPKTASVIPHEVARPHGTTSPWGPTAQAPKPLPKAAKAKKSTSVFRFIGSTFNGVSRVFRTIKYLYFGILILTLLGFMWSNPMDRMNAIGVPFETVPARP